MEHTMLSRIQVGPPVITMHQGSTFIATAENGEIAPDSELGLFSKDTRLVSCYRILLDGRPWTLATSGAVSYHGARYCFVSPELVSHRGSVPERKLELRLERAIDESIHEDFDLTNYSGSEVSVHLEIVIESDFADLFDVKTHQVTQRGQIDTVWNVEKGELVSQYRNKDFERAVIYQTVCDQTKPHFANGRIRFDIVLAPGASWHSCGHIVPVIGGSEGRRPSKCYQAIAGDSEIHRLQQQWRDTTTKIATPNQDVQKAFDQAVYDIGALRLYEHDVDDMLWMPAAGVPWFVTIFGRDSLVVSLQNMMVNCPLAKGTLKRLAEFQAKERDDWRDAQPGKILHEVRFGELAHFKLVPYVPYYGTADATILFLILLSETFLWTGEEELLREYRDPALRCLEWIDRYGDIDGDGFQDYKTFSSQGYHNMGWKDAGDAVVYPDGSVVEQPIATCELQGYVHDAKLRMAKVFEALGERTTADQLRGEAEILKRRFNEAFWMEDEGFYAYALDPEKKPVNSIASNPGHLLWSGIVDPPDRAARVVRRLLEPDMFSGWGVRTLSKRHRAYDPHAYQLGSVWAHDNAFIAAGAKRYGLWQETNQIARAIFGACAAFRSYRLPEVFAGLDRSPDGFPVQYIGANIPQAWASGAIFLLLQSMLGIAANAPEGALLLQPTLPEWLPEITVSNLQIGQHRIAVRVEGSGERSSCEILNNEGNLKIAFKPIGSS